MQVDPFITALCNFALGCSYLFGIAGSVGMMIFATTFPFSTSIRDLRLSPERFLGLDGYRVWMVSWSLILTGGFIQLIRFLAAQWSAA